jgi:hypothetical protein
MILHLIIIKITTDNCRYMEKNRVQLVISINVHENIKFLSKQLSNINAFVKLNYIIILNCNTLMYKTLMVNNAIRAMHNVIINKDYFEKRRFCGLLVKGICANMSHILKNYIFEYFLVLSSRNIFYNVLDESNYKCIPPIHGTHLNAIDTKVWHWHSFLRTKLSAHCTASTKIFGSGAHEGLMFNYDGCMMIQKFLDNNSDVKNELFGWNHCVEEFALQTICCMNGSHYYDIGLGCETTYCMNDLPKNKFVCKIERK